MSHRYNNFSSLQPNNKAVHTMTHYFSFLTTGMTVTGVPGVFLSEKACCMILFTSYVYNNIMHLAKRLIKQLVIYFSAP